MVLWSDRHPHDVCQKYAIYLSVLTGNDHPTILNRNPSHRTHRSINERAVVGLDHEAWSNFRLGLGCGFRLWLFNRGRRRLFHARRRTAWSRSTAACIAYGCRSFSLDFGRLLNRFRFWRRFRCWLRCRRSRCHFGDWRLGFVDSGAHRRHALGPGSSCFCGRRDGCFCF